GLRRSFVTYPVNTIRGASAFGEARRVNAMVTRQTSSTSLHVRGAPSGSHGFGRRGAERNAPRVITIEPGRVLVPALHPRVGARYGLNARRARLTVRLVSPERAREVVAFDVLQAAREDGSIFHSGRAALGHVRRHRMTRIAQEHDASGAPAGKRLALENRPLVAVRAGFQNGAYVGMESFVGVAELIHVAFGRPRLARHPFRRLRDAGDEVDLAPIGLRVIADDVAIDAPPFGAGRSNVPAAHQRRRKHGTIGDAPLVDWRVGADDDFAHDGM